MSNKTREELRPDWSKAPDWAKWYAINARGDANWFENEPEPGGCSGGHWHHHNGRVLYAHVRDVIGLGGLDWRELKFPRYISPEPHPGVRGKLKWSKDFVPVWGMLPDEAIAWAVDSDGSAYAFRDVPRLDESAGVWVSSAPFYTGTIVDMCGVDWRNTLCLKSPAFVKANPKSMLPEASTKLKANFELNRLAEEAWKSLLSNPDWESNPEGMAVEAFRCAEAFIEERKRRGPVKERRKILKDWEVAAVRAGTKTAIRVLAKPQPELIGRWWTFAGGNWSDGITSVSVVPGHSMAVLSPLGIDGDRIWLPETFQVVGPAANPRLVYRVDDGSAAPRWNPPLGMWREACRVVVEIRCARLERLQAVTEYDARQEGSFLDRCACMPRIDDKTPIQRAFKLDWCHKHGKRFDLLWSKHWHANPWTWVYWVSLVKPD